MPDYKSVDAQANQEMVQFLAGLNQPNTETPGQAPSTPQVTPQAVVPDEDVKEDAFYADDEDGDATPGTQDTPMGNSEQPPASQSSVQPPQQPQNTYAAGVPDLDTQLKLAEERGRSAAYYEMVKSGFQPQQPVHDQQPQQSVSYFQPEDVTFTPEEEQTFSPETRQFAAKIANQAVKRLVDTIITPMQEELSVQRSTIASYGAGVAKTNSQVLYSQVQAEVPDLPQIVQSNEWRAFMQEPTPFDSSVRVGDVFLSHLHKGNKADILNVIKAFKAKNPASQMQMQMAPGQSSVGVPPTTIADRKPKQLDYQKYLDAQQRWQQGKMPYSEYAKIEAIFDKAQLEGRIKY